MGTSKIQISSQMQGAEKFSLRRICLICKPEIFPQRRSWDEIWIFEVPIC
jgi:hypothetical protein